MAVRYFRSADNGLVIWGAAPWSSAAACWRFKFRTANSGILGIHSRATSVGAASCASARPSVWPLEIGRFLRSAAARRPLLHLESPVRASEGSPGQAWGRSSGTAVPLAPPWVSVPTNSSPLPPNRPLLGDSGGEVLLPLHKCPISSGQTFGLATPSQRLGPVPQHVLATCLS